jgi:ferredoxin
MRMLTNDDERAFRSQDGAGRTAPQRRRVEERPSSRGRAVASNPPTITIDREACMGSGVCMVYAPNTFATDDETKAIVIDACGDDASALLAAQAGCPMSAITVTFAVPLARDPSP